MLSATIAGRAPRGCPAVMSRAVRAVGGRGRPAVLCAAGDSGRMVSEVTAQRKRELLSLLGDGGEGGQRMARTESRQKIEELVSLLCEDSPEPAPVKSPRLLGRWLLLATFKPGTANVDFFSVDSWTKYLFDKGPSPVQSLVLGDGKVAGVSQILEDPQQEGSCWQNVVQFGEGNQLVIEAALEGVRDDSSFFYRFSGGFFKLKGGQRIPYPVPFDLLEALRPGQTKGWFATPYLDKDLRISVGDKGSVFVLCRPAGDDWETEGLVQ